MKTFLSLALALASLCTPALAESTMNVAHLHLHHVATEWSETPDQLGFLPTALKDANTAEMHIKLAMSSRGDLDLVKQHVGHVIHALDPTEQQSGPGTGYGLIEGAKGAEKHMLYAAQSPGASENIISSNLAVRNPLKNAASLAKSAVRRGKAILRADSTDDAADDLEAMAWLVNAMIHGIDENGDGDIAADRKEGGLAIASEGLASIMNTEGL